MDDDRTADLAEDLLRTVARLNRAVNRRSEMPMPTSLVRYLAHLDDLGAQRIGDLAQTDGVSQPSVSTAVRKLEQLGLVQRIPDPSDARACLIDLTPEGRAGLARTRAVRVAALAPYVEDLTDQERSELLAGLAAVRRLLADLQPG